MMKFLRKFFSSKNKNTQQTPSDLNIGDLEVVPSSLSGERIEKAIPGTANLPRIIDLIPPPITRPQELTDQPLEDQNVEPNWNIDIISRFKACEVFLCKALQSALEENPPSLVLTPEFYVVTPKGIKTYLSSSNAPPEGIELIVSWSPHQFSNTSPETILKEQVALNVFLTSLPFGFSSSCLSEEEILKKFERVEAINDLTPDYVSITAYPDANQPFDGKEIWNLLHAMGFKWGDMDCFQWEDPTGQTDYLIWVEPNDGKIGYVLPELVASGEQNFTEVTFSITPPQTPSAVHVFDQLMRAVNTFQKETDCNLTAKIDDELADSPDELREAIVELCAELEEMNLKSGCDEICVVR
ncbi:cell division protein ZipA C-terminal FtsZ-binding domain-containing protein [Pseudovibrio ascidiaceicola]|uniref:cell division protein ZipA C-terminal FtsZ-binding domain-containing protein n=1 Tax=Pseudovibrio ascidiaceicola TaxID=285279 RepID=UPI000D69E516|nr:cell division protein ZipA C-terminal FtsZ-binding domain-containing protein [Pseudovibrio ascidiaceicola]